jgi:hypothetical protein
MRPALLAWALATASASVFHYQGLLDLLAGTYIIKLWVDLSGFHDHCTAFHNNTERVLQSVANGAAKFVFNQTVLVMKDACEHAECWPK